MAEEPKREVEEPKRETDALQAGNYTLGADAAPDAGALGFAKPALTVVDVPLKAQPLELQLELEGYSAADRCAIRFFYTLMREHPDGVPGKKKDNHLHDCREHLRAHGEHVAERRLAELWTRAIDFTGATAYRKPGPDTNS
jgi:hypothetical protein